MHRVMIGYPTADLSRCPEFYDRLAMVKTEEGWIRTGTHGRSPAANRNLIIKAAKVNNCTHVMFFDDDMIFEPDIVNKLLAHDKDIVSGLYLMHAFPHRAVAFDYVDNTNAHCLHLDLKDGKTGLIPVVAVGLGCCLIKMEVFDKLEEPWIRLGELDPENWSDDIGFCYRAKKAGFEIWLDLDVQVGHHGSKIVRPTYKDGVWYSSYDTGGTGFAFVPQLHWTENELEELNKQMKEKGFQLVHA